MSIWVLLLFAAPIVAIIIAAIVYIVPKARADQASLVVGSDEHKNSELSEFTTTSSIANSADTAESSGRESNIHSAPQQGTSDSLQGSQPSYNRTAVARHQALKQQLSKMFKNDGITPKIGYKRAFMLASDDGEERYFTGVAGIAGSDYAPDSDASYGTPGFHAYSDFQEAARHTQKGNVLLEVLLSGEIEEHELGYTAQHQRVLQIISDRCSLCKMEATHFAHDPRFDKVAFFCDEHYELSHEMLQNGDIHTSSGFRPVIGRFGDMHTALPWIAEHNILTTTQSGSTQFVPTVLTGY